MKVPLSWLKKFLNLDRLSAEQIADTLTLAGLEVDKIEFPALAFQGVVVGEVVAASAHPNADKLRVATVSDGTEEYQVVCGAPNCRSGIKVAFAKINATLRDEEGKVWKIKKSKLRDVESFGMLCSGKELGLSADKEGIIELPSHFSLGADLALFYSDPVFEISLTPNLGHCMSILGIARELSALLNLPLLHPSLDIRENTQQEIAPLLSVSIKDSDNCLRYCCRMIQGITVGPSPEWLTKALESCGLRSINNVVDVSNYIMWAYGQPLHIFDYAHITDQTILVDSQTSYESLLTLDNNLREVPKGALLICDPVKPLAFAGIMGGKDSAVSETTRDIVIESAYFSPLSIRRTSKQLNLRTDASLRFERGIDPAALIEVLNRAASLIQEVAGGSICKGVIDVCPHPLKTTHISCRIDRLNQLLGTHLTLGEVVSILQRLHIHQDPSAKIESDKLTLCVPPYRHDLNTEIDIVEEVARLYGYHHIPKKIPYFSSSTLPSAPIYLFENEVRFRLIAEGLQECLTCDLIGPSLAKLTAEQSLPEDALIHVLHPASLDQSILRASLLPGLLEVIRLNGNHHNDDISAFEVGRIHFKEGEHYKEFSSAAIILTGKSRPYHFDPKPKEVDFFDLKGMVENLLESLGVLESKFTPSHLHNFHPGRQARIQVDDLMLGVLGEVHPSHLSALNIEERVFFAEINLHDLFSLRQNQLLMTPLPLYPGSERDWTLTLKEETPISILFKAVKEIDSPLLEKIILLDLYKSEQIGKDKKNATFRFLYRDPLKTLSMEMVEREHTKITHGVAKRLRDHILEVNHEN